MVERLSGVADELGTNLPVLSMAWILQSVSENDFASRLSEIDD